MKYLKVFLLILIFPVALYSQPVKKITGEYLYVVPESMSIDQAKVMAVDRARIAALADEFGTVISNETATSMRGTQSTSKVDFMSIGMSEVKGEWLRDIKEPEIEMMFVNNVLTVKATVHGEAREIRYASIDFEARVLRNGTDKKFEDADFLNGDHMYLYFKSPVDGYLAVYLTDSESAWCLLPYMQNSSGIFEVQAGIEYCLFSVKEAPDVEKHLVDEYVLTCGDVPEYNQIHVIFSKNSFIKANDVQAEDTLPRELSFEEFLKWESRSRIYDKHMTLKKIPVTVSPR